jgi:hypothetical protein
MPDPPSIDQLRQAASSLDQLHQVTSQRVDAIGHLWERAVYPLGKSRAVVFQFLDGSDPAARKILVAVNDLPKAAQDKLRAYIQ